MKVEALSNMNIRCEQWHTAQHNSMIVKQRQNRRLWNFFITLSSFKNVFLFYHSPMFTTRGTSSNRFFYVTASREEIEPLLFVYTRAEKVGVAWKFSSNLILKIACSRFIEKREEKLRINFVSPLLKIQN